MEEERIIDQSQLASDLSNKIHYEFSKDFLVKPLDPIKVQKEFDTPIAKSEAKEDKNGVEAVDYDEVKTEIKEVESDYRKAVVLKVPHEYVTMMASENYPAMPVNVGDIIIYPNRCGKWFDLLKDTHLVKSYDILGVEKTVKE